MRNINLRTLTFTTSLLAVTFALATTTTGCSTGSDNPATGGAGTTGAAGAGTGAAGTGAAGTGSTGAAGTGSTGAAGSGNTGAAGTGSTGAAGTGSTGAAGAPPITGVCAGMGTRVVALENSKVESFEDMAIVSPAWSTFSDVAAMPDAAKMTLEAPGALGTGHAGHYVGTGAKLSTMMGYGVGAVYNAAIDKTAGIFCVDITAFDGVTFWAKGKAGTHLGVNFSIPQTNKAPDGDCTSMCYNHPQKIVSLTTEWSQITVPFAAAMAGAVKVQGRIQQLVFLSPEADWDYSIDEIQFYKGTPPTGAAM